MLDLLDAVVELLDAIFFSKSRKDKGASQGPPPDYLLTPGQMVFFSFFYSIVGSGVFLVGILMVVPLSRQEPMNPLLLVLLIVLVLLLAAGIAVHVRMVQRAKQEKSGKRD